MAQVSRKSVERRTVFKQTSEGDPNNGNAVEDIGNRRSSTLDNKTDKTEGDVWAIPWRILTLAEWPRVKCCGLLPPATTSHSRQRPSFLYSSLREDDTLLYK